MNSRAGAAAGPPAGAGASRPARNERAARKPAVGIVALVVAVLTFLLMPIATIVVNQPAFIGQASTISGNVMTVQLLGMIVALGLGLVAIITRRGRAWGLAALALIGVLVLMAVFSVVMSLLGGGASTPVR